MSTIETKSPASFATTVIAVTILLMLSLLFSRVTINVLVFVLRVVFYVTRYMYDARRQDFALSASFVSEQEGAYSGKQVSPAWKLDREMRRRLILQET